MNPIRLATLILLMVGGLNWGLVGLLNIDLVAAIFGAESFLARSVYILVGVAAILQLIHLPGALGGGERLAQRESPTR